MLIRIPQVLTIDQAAAIRARIDDARWIDGTVTAGHQSAQAKHNEQLPEDSAVAREAGKQILDGLQRSQLFFTAALPQQIYPPLFNRYLGGMDFGSHVDGAVRVHAPTGGRIRADLSATVFLTPPEDYDGGELVIEDAYGTHSVKSTAGDMVLYPATSLHRVMPVTRGTRISSFFWIQSMVRDDARRALLFDLDMAIIALAQDRPNQPALVSLTATYHNLLRMWAEV